MTTLQQRAAPLLAKCDGEHCDYLDLRNSGAVHRVPSVREHYYPDLAALLREALGEIERLQQAHLWRSMPPHCPTCSCDEDLPTESIVQKMHGGGATAFTGRRTARDNPDIPTDAGVPEREWPDEARIDVIGQQGNTRDHYPQAEILSQSRQQVGDLAVSFTVGRIKEGGG